MGVYLLNGLRTFGPNIKCRSLRLYAVLFNQFEPNIQIEKDLELQFCMLAEALPDIPIQGNLVVEGVVNTKQGNVIEHRLKLPERGLVYGNMTIPQSIDIPADFCCLGTVTKVD